MNAHDLNAMPTIADEESAVVDDAQVIDKTLPARRPSQPQTLIERMDCAIDATRDFINKEPMQAVMIAAAASSVLTMILTRRSRTFD